MEARLQPEVVKLERPEVRLPAGLERNRIIGVEATAAALGLSVAHVRRLYRTKKLPAPVKIGGRKLGWPAHVVESIIAGGAQR